MDDREEDAGYNARHLVVSERLNTLLRHIDAMIGLDLTEPVVGGLPLVLSVVRDDGVPPWAHRYSGVHTVGNLGAMRRNAGTQSASVLWPDRYISGTVGGVEVS
jgi:hypothetical protein